ncbi:MAG: NAD-dependent deacylase [Polyangiales bacterium]|nr:NAD-dependent deacylase [Myxococcales bacterium]
MTEDLARAVERLRDGLARVRSVLFITGAGVSADSGLPTYRGVGGLYDAEDTDEGVPIEVALSGSMFRRNPELTWKYIAQIERACRGAEPNLAHRAMAALEQRVPRAWVLTQNVDGLHRRAGSTNLIEIHGGVHELHCTACAYETTVADYSSLAPLPRCPSCDAVVRPRVVLFEEQLPPTAVTALEHELATGFDAVVSVGTTSVFPYIRAPLLLARSRGKFTAEINPGETEVSRAVDVKLAAGAADVFALLRPWWDA